MEIVVNLEPWPDDSPVRHDSTKFIVLDGNKLEVTHETTTSMVFVKEIDIPIGSTYYVVAERQFSLKDSNYDISNINYRSEEFVISNNETEISNMLLAKDIVIETPYIFIDRNDIINGTSDTFVINSSKYKGIGDGHTHSHWIIKYNGEIIHRVINNRVNKTSITLEKNLVKNLPSFEVYCTHCSNNIESSIGKLKITLNTLNFELTNNITSLVSTGTKLLIKRINTTRPLGLTKITIKHQDEVIKIIETDPLLEDDFSYILSSTILEIKRDMIIELYGNDITGELGRKVYKLDMIDNLYNNDSINIDVKYDMKLESISFEGKLPVIVSDSFRNNVFIPNNNMLEVFNVSEDGSLTYNKSIQSLSLGNVTKDNMFIKYTDDNYLIVDAMLDMYNGNHPRFIVFKHDVYKDTFTITNVMDRNDELYPLGYNNAIEFLGNGDFIYSIYGSNEMKKVNYLTGTIVNTKPIPETEIDGAMIMKMLDNNILVLSNKTHKSYIYNIEENNYRSAMSIPFNQIINKDLKKLDLANGDKVLFTIDDNTSDGTLVWFNSKESTLTVMSDKIKIPASNYSLYRKNNENFIAIYKEKDYLTYPVDTILVDKIV